jgi:hypothetical protein
MKKITLILIGTAIVFAACHKRSKEVSQVVIASKPTVTLTGSQFYTINVGGSLPTVSATAYDSVLHESYSVTLDQSTLDNTTPGLYIVKATAKNKNGYIGSSNVYIAVTEVPDATDLSGQYQRAENGIMVTVEKVSRGLYFIDNLGGSTLVVPAYFAQTSDTTIDVPLQPSDAAGDIYATDASLNLTPPDTVFKYKVVNSAFGTTFRTFVKQH